MLGMGISLKADSKGAICCFDPSFVTLILLRLKERLRDCLIEGTFSF